MKKEDSPVLKIHEGKHYWAVFLALLLSGCFAWIFASLWIRELMNGFDKDILLIILLTGCWGGFSAILVVLVARRLRIVTIYKDKVVSETLTHKVLGLVKLNEPVYYSIYLQNHSDQSDPYILISNNPYPPNEKIRYKRDDERQINILYTKKVRCLFPHEDWEEIKLIYPKW